MPPVCKVCFSYMLSGPTGRPPATCSEPCRLAWKAARQKAQRAQKRALSALRMAASALDPVDPTFKKEVLRLAARLSKANPTEIAVVSAPDSLLFRQGPPEIV